MLLYAPAPVFLMAQLLQCVEYYTPDPTMALADILLIIWEVASTILTISWTYFVVLLEVMHQIYISHNGGATADTEDTQDE